MGNEVQGVTLKIERNQGLTQALWALVAGQNMDLSDGSISASEWQATTDKLAQIQQNRQNARNNASIFTGGTEKNDWHHNYVVKEGQEVEFSKDEMKELYAAMGVSFTHAQDTGTADSETTSDIQDENGNKTGTLTKKYDANGKLISETEQNTEGKNVKETLYDRDEQGNLTRRRVRGYDENGNQITTDAYRPDGTIEYRITDIKDNSDNSGSDKMTNYDEDGINMVGYAQREYNSNGNITKETQYTPDDKLANITVNEYYDDGENVKKKTVTFYNEDGSVQQTEVTNYDEEGNEIEG